MMSEKPGSWGSGQIDGQSCNYPVICMLPASEVIEPTQEELDDLRARMDNAAAIHRIDFPRNSYDKYLNDIS
jgi:hypothetical protein